MHRQMILSVSAIILGTLLPLTNSLILCIFILGGCLAATRFWSWRCSGVALILACLCWGSIYSHLQLIARLPEAQSGEVRELSGCVVEDSRAGDTLRQGQKVIRFDLALNESARPLRKVRISWYEPDVSVLEEGDCLTLTATLRRPRNFSNGLAFDYQAFLLQSGVDATGYVRKVHSYQPGGRRMTGESYRHDVDAWIRGLVFGDAEAFSGAQWQLVKDTGTLHLLVVSGLHVGIIAALAYGLMNVLLRSGAALGLRVGSGVHWLSRLGVIIVTGIYVVNAGSGISLLRAWGLTALLILLWGTGRRLRYPVLLLLVMLLVLLWDPLVWLSAGFQYSFAAVFALMLLLEGRQNGRITPWFTPQLAIFALMLPLMSLWDQPVSPVHLIANTLLIPLVTFLLLPLSLLVALTGQDWIADLLNGVGVVFWDVQHLLVSWEWPSLVLPPLAVISALFVVWLVRAGASWRLGLLSIVLICAVSFFQGRHESGLWLFDAGQGQSLMVREGAVTLVIDTGPRLSPDFSVAGAVVVPWLRRTGAHELSLLVLSHSDNDHAGGADVLEAALPVRRVLAGQPEQHAGHQATSCHDAGDVHLADELMLRFFTVPENMRRSDNDYSCVVQIHWRGRTLMVPGDISRATESALVERYGAQLQSHILIASHHGSRSGNSSEWLATISPHEVWVSAGFNNRYGHPHQDVMKRWRNAGIPVQNTADTGMLFIDGDGHRDCGVCGWQPLWR